MSTEPRRFTNDSTHHIITSLTVIIGNAQLLARKIGGGDNVPPDLMIEALRLIQREGHRIAAEMRDDWQANETERISTS